MKTVEEIYETLKADMAQRAGFVPEDGCDLAVRLWAAAAQIQALEIQADWVLELGPGSGRRGGELVFAGTPAQLAEEKTATGLCLEQALL